MHASGVGCRFGIDVVVVSQGAMRARYCVEGAESPRRRTDGRVSRRDRPGAVGTSRRGATPSSCSAELRAPPAVPPARPRRRSGAGEHHRRAVRPRDLEHGSGDARRAAAPHRGRAGSLRSALAFARWSQSSRRRLGGRGAARARPSRGGGVATSALAAVAGSGRHRLGGDRAERDRHRDREQDQDVRRSPSRSGAGAGGVAVAAPAKMGTKRCPCSHVPCSCAGRRTGRARRHCGVHRPVDARPSRRGGNGARRAFSRMRK